MVVLIGYSAVQPGDIHDVCPENFEVINKEILYIISSIPKTYKYKQI